MRESEQAIGRPLGARPPRRLGVIVLCVALFVVGAVCGGGGTALLIRSRVRDALHHPEHNRERLLKVVDGELDLDEQQYRQVDQILRQRQRAMLDIRRQSLPLVNRQIDLAEQQVGQVLRPDQREKWARLLADFRRNWVPEPPPPDEGEPSTRPDPQAVDRGIADD